MKRRLFLQTLLGITTAIALPVLTVLGRILPARQVEAIRARLYPGPVCKRNKDEMLKPSPWKG